MVGAIVGWHEREIERYPDDDDEMLAGGWDVKAPHYVFLFDSSADVM